MTVEHDNLMTEIVSITRAGHQRIVTRMCRPERLMRPRQNGCPLAIRLWADQPMSYSTWRDLHEEDLWLARSESRTSNRK